MGRAPRPDRGGTGHSRCRAGTVWAAVEGREIPLYQALAERLLAKYGLVASVATPEGDRAPNGTTVLLRPYHELNDAVCALARRGRRVQDLYRPINELLKALLDAPQKPRSSAAESG